MITQHVIHANSYFCQACIFLQAQPKIHLPDSKAKALMERIQNAGTEVVEAKVQIKLLHVYYCCRVPQASVLYVQKALLVSL